MISNQFDIAHVTITFTSPMIVGSGTGSDFSDAICIQDPNGLPTIPGTSIAGVLRHAMVKSWNHDASLSKTYRKQFEKELFGGAGITHSEGRRSLLTVSWAHLHDSNNRPVSHAVFTEDITATDPVLQTIKRGIFRDHVRIDPDTGTAAHTGKFDETLVPRGARFTFALMLDTAKNQTGVKMSDLVAQLQRPDVFFGGKSRRGFGAFEVTQVQYESFNLDDSESFSRFTQYSFDVSASFDFAQPNWEQEVNSDLRNEATYSVQLQAKDYLLPGGGAHIDAVFPYGFDFTLRDRLEHADMFPVYDIAIRWQDQGVNKQVGEVTPPRFYIPATSIKGTLRHRVLFYARLLAGCFQTSANDTVQEHGVYDYTQPDRFEDLDSAELAINTLFGSAENDDKGKPGLVYIAEPVFSADTSFRVMQHVALDRFTQGPLQSALFGEVLLELATQPFDLRIDVDWLSVQERLEQSTVKLLQRSMELAIQDLVSQRLTLGAAGSRGHGMMYGSYTKKEGVSDA